MHHEEVSFYEFHHETLKQLINCSNKKIFLELLLNLTNRGLLIFLLFSKLGVTSMFICKTTDAISALYVNITVLEHAFNSSSFAVDFQPLWLLNM